MSAKRPIVHVLVACALALALAAGGCVRKPKASWVGEPAAFFEGARNKVEKVKSMRISGDMEVQYNLGGMDMAMSADYEGAFRETQDRGLVGSMKVNTRMEGAGGDMDQSLEVFVYTEGNRIYARLPGDGRWVYREFDPGEMWGGIGQDPLSVNPQGIMMTLQVAKSLELVEEGEQYAVFSFRIDPEKVVTEDTLAKFQEALAQFGGKNLDQEEIRESLSEIIEMMKFTMKVDRDSQLPLELTQETTGNLLDVMVRLVPEAGMASGGSIGMRMTFRFSDYGADFPVDRPQGIENATPM